MNISSPLEAGHPHSAMQDTSNPGRDRQLSPSPSLNQETSATTEMTFSLAPDNRDEASRVKAESPQGSKIKKKLSELDIRGAMADLDIRKTTKRVGIEEFYIQLDEPHRMFYPGDVVKGTVNLILERPVKTQYVILKLTGLLSVSMVREKAEHVIVDEELILWGKKIPQAPSDAREDGTEHDVPKKQKDEWETQMMDEGEHPFPFELELPSKSLPSSIAFGKGSITYTIRCIHQRPPSLLGAMKNRSLAQRDVPIQDVIDVAAVRVPKPQNIRLPCPPKKGRPPGEIMADIELHKAGYLKGDQIRLNLKIKHVIPIKNLKGAIVTFYRMSRFDSEKSEGSVFRKDLAQTVSPIICDPETLKGSISPHIRIPPDTFPTLDNVKHMSFKYYLEVILDLSPKTSVYQTSSTSQDYIADEIKQGPSNFIDTMEILKKSKPYLHLFRFDIVVGTIDSAAKDLDQQPRRQEQSLHHYSRSSGDRRVSMGTFPSAPDLARRRDSVRSSMSSLSSFARHPPPPPPFPRGSSSPTGISLAGGPREPSRSGNSRASLSKSILTQGEESLLPSAPPERSNAIQEASAPPITVDNDSNEEIPIASEAPQIHISHSHERLTGLRVEIPQSEQVGVSDDERYLASLQSRVSAPVPSVRASSSRRIRRRPVSREIEEASAPPLDDSTEDNISVSDRVSVVSTLPLYTEQGYDHS